MYSVETFPKEMCSRSVMKRREVYCYNDIMRKGGASLHVLMRELGSHPTVYEPGANIGYLEKEVVEVVVSWHVNGVVKASPCISNVDTSH